MTKFGFEKTRMIDDWGNIIRDGEIIHIDYSLAVLTRHRRVSDRRRTDRIPMSTMRFVFI